MEHSCPALAYQFVYLKSFASLILYSQVIIQLDMLTMASPPDVCEAHPLGIAHGVQQHSPDEALPARLSLMGLPAEVRLMVLRYLLDSRDVFEEPPPIVADRYAEVQESETESESGSDSDLEEQEEEDNACDSPKDTHDEHEHRQDVSDNEIASTLIIDDDAVSSSSRHDSVLSPSIHPKILQTCHQLYNEGIRIMYADKTVHVAYYFVDDEWVKPRGFVLGKRSVRAALRQYPSLKLITRWVIDFYCDSYEGSYQLGWDIEWCEGLDEWSNFLSQEAAALRSVTNIDHLRIATEFMMDIPSPAVREQYMSLFCNRSRVLRAKRVSIIPLHEAQIDARIKADIESSRPAVDLSTMRDNLLSLVEKIIKKSNRMEWTGDEFVRLDDDYYDESYYEYGEYSIVSFGSTKQVADVLRKLDWPADWDIDQFYNDAKELLPLTKDYLQRALADLETRATKADALDLTKAPNEEKFGNRDWDWWGIEQQLNLERGYKPPLSKQGILRKRDWFQELKSMVQKWDEETDDLLALCDAATSAYDKLDGTTSTGGHTTR